MHYRLPAGSTRTRWGSLQCSPRPFSWIWGRLLLSRGEETREEGGDRRSRKGEEGVGEGGYRNTRHCPWGMDAPACGTRARDALRPGVACGEGFPSPNGLGFWGKAVPSSLIVLKHAWKSQKNETVAIEQADKWHFMTSCVLPVAMYVTCCVASEHTSTQLVLCQYFSSIVLSVHWLASKVSGYLAACHWINDNNSALNSGGSRHLVWGPRGGRIKAPKAILWPPCKILRRSSRGNP